MYLSKLWLIAWVCCCLTPNFRELLLIGLCQVDATAGMENSGSQSQ